MNLFAKIKQSPKIRWFILANIVLGTFMATLDSSIVNVVLPTLSTEFKVDLSGVHWVVVAYLLGISCFLPIFGRLADALGRKTIYSTGLLIFTIGSLLCGLSYSLWFLVGMRVLQAIGASMLMSNNQAIVVSTFPDHERGRAMGISGTAVALGSLVGPALGGFLISWVGWRFIFYINIPIGLIAYIAAQIILPSDTKNKEISFDFRGSILFVIGLLSFLFAINSGQAMGWGSMIIISSFILGGMLLVWFVLMELRIKNPLIDFNIYRNHAFMLGNVSGFLSFVATFSFSMLMPFYLQHIMNYSTYQVGLMMAIFPICMAVVAPISGYVSDKIGPVFLTTGGLILMMGGLLCFLTVNINSVFWQIAPGVILLGIGSGMFQSPNNSSVMGSVRPDQIGIAAGLSALLRNLGMIVGASLSVVLFENKRLALLSDILNPSAYQLSSTFVIAFHAVMLVAAAITFISAIISVNRKSYV